MHLNEPQDDFITPPPMLVPYKRGQANPTHLNQPDPRWNLPTDADDRNIMQ